MLNKILTLALFSTSALVANAADEIKPVAFIFASEETDEQKPAIVTEQVAIDGEEEVAAEEIQTAEV